METKEEIFRRLMYAEQMVKEYLGHDWNFMSWGFRRAWGKCFLEKKLIKINRKMLYTCTNVFFESVLFHEIAHGLAWPNDYGHCSPIFKQYCRYFSAHSTRTTSFNSIPPKADEIKFTFSLHDKNILNRLVKR